MLIEKYYILSDKPTFYNDSLIYRNKCRISGNEKEYLEMFRFSWNVNVCMWISSTKLYGVNFLQDIFSRRISVYYITIFSHNYHTNFT